ncbi:MAG: hypothetical protein JSS86_13450 [Cyanobacteria bacterium SZAS LIN-2]|nr:hypothetical protein [Cyanobacteria bacterium SZAS LIN-2]MBS2007381.1 hypothetical protein [Cyanobacteria bacterium SZAS TMP-1]
MSETEKQTCQSVRDPLPDDDAAFLEMFETCSLSGKCWTHTAHVRMAWLQMERASTYEEALQKIRTGIMTFNKAIQSVGYHETVTVAFARLIYDRRQADPGGTTWLDFLARNGDLLSKESPILHLYYSPEILATDEARRIFVAPDRKPLPEPLSNQAGASHLPCSSK